MGRSNTRDGYRRKYDYSDHIARFQEQFTAENFLAMFMEEAMDTSHTPNGEIIMLDMFV